MFFKILFVNFLQVKKYLSNGHKTNKKKKNHTFLLPAEIMGGIPWIRLA